MNVCEYAHIYEKVCIFGKYDIISSVRTDTEETGKIRIPRGDVVSRSCGERAVGREV